MSNYSDLTSQLLWHLPVNLTALAQTITDPNVMGSDAKSLEPLYTNRSSLGIVDWFSHWLYDSESN
ncbi:hypothetical protein NSTCB13_04532 [Nostoc sp. DSM 114160]